MELVLGLPALFALVVGFVAVRRVIARRKQSLQAYTHTRDQRLMKSRPKDMRSKRSEMRALDDPRSPRGRASRSRRAGRDASSRASSARAPAHLMPSRSIR